MSEACTFLQTLLPRRRGRRHSLLMCAMPAAKKQRSVPPLTVAERQVLVAGLPPCKCADAFPPATTEYRCPSCEQLLFTARAVLDEVELLPSEYHVAGVCGSGRALRVCAQCVCHGVEEVYFRPHKMAPGLACACGQTAIYRILCPQLDIGGAGMIVYESSLCATPASRPILSITALTELIKAASQNRQLLLLKGGEAWCPFSRLLDDCVARFASTVQQHEDELADVDALLRRVRFATLELGSTDEGAHEDGSVHSWVCSQLAVPRGLPVPWLCAVWDGRRIPLDNSVGSKWQCQDGLLLGASICKASGALPLLCESILSGKGVL